MFSTRLNLVFRSIISNNHTRCLSTSSKCYKKFENPLKRTFRILRDDIRGAFHPIEYLKKNRQLDAYFPHHVDVVIIGGAAMGSSVAHFLKQKTGVKGLSVCVVEKDMTYQKCSTTLSVGGLRQQFSLPENVQMSLFGAEFIRSLRVEYNEDVSFTPHGYLMLASIDGAQQLTENSQMQNSLGANNIILSKDQIKQKFPWMNIEDVEVGCLGLEKEGWFDPWAFLSVLKRSATEMGTQYVKGEVVGFTFSDQEDYIVDGTVAGSYQGVNELMVKLPNGDLKSITFAYCVIATGSESGEFVKLAKIGTGKGILEFGLPVEPRKRYVYCFECKDNPPTINTPMTIDFTGPYFRREGLGGLFICGLSPTCNENEPCTSNLEVDYSYFDQEIWPLLAHRVPAFNGIKVRNSWSGFYDYNTFDENGIIGFHPYYHNILLATGFSGHGIQQAPAVGRAISELIVDGRFQTLDLTRLTFERLLRDKPMQEICII